jgi:hypothetical protein
MHACVYIRVRACVYIHMRACVCTSDAMYISLGIRVVCMSARNYCNVHRFPRYAYEPMSFTYVFMRLLRFRSCGEFLPPFVCVYACNVYVCLNVTTILVLHVFIHTCIRMCVSFTEVRGFACIFILHINYLFHHEGLVM